LKRNEDKEGDHAEEILVDKEQIEDKKILVSDRSEISDVMQEKI